MSGNMNRFAMLSMDDDSSDELQPKVEMIEQPPIVVPIAIPGTKRDSNRKWTLDNGKPAETREWNLERSGRGRGRGRGGPFSRYAFHDDERPRVPRIRTYGFRDDSPPRETMRTTTPNSSHTPPYPPCSPIPVLPLEEPEKKPVEQTQVEEASKAPEQPHVTTLADRVRIAMERREKEINSEPPERRTISMDTVIPMSSAFNRTIILN